MIVFETKTIYKLSFYRTSLLTLFCIVNSTAQCSHHSPTFPLVPGPQRSWKSIHVRFPPLVTLPLPCSLDHRVLSACSRYSPPHHLSLGTASSLKADSCLTQWDATGGSAWHWCRFPNKFCQVWRAQHSTTTSISSSLWKMWSGKKRDLSNSDKKTAKRWGASKSPPAVPASHIGNGLSPSCSTSHPFPCYCTMQSSTGWHKCLRFCTRLGDSEEAPGS